MVHTAASFLAVKQFIETLLGETNDINDQFQSTQHYISIGEIENWRDEKTLYVANMRIASYEAKNYTTSKLV